MRSVILRAVFGALLAAPAAVFVSTSTASAASTSEGCLPGSLRQRLAQVRSQFGPIRVISTHRPGARIAGSGRQSLHASCQAVDFVPPAGKYSQVAAWLRANHGGGVGTYSSGHIHIDSGAMVRFHRGGGGSSYASAGRSNRYAGRGRSGSRTAAASRGRRGGYSETAGQFYAPAPGV
jgi:hypothetical protein